MSGKAWPIRPCTGGRVQGHSSVEVAFDVGGDFGVGAGCWREKST